MCVLSGLDQHTVFTNINGIKRKVTKLNETGSNRYVL